MKFLAVLAVLAMAFAAFAVTSEDSDAGTKPASVVTVLANNTSTLTAGAWYYVSGTIDTGDDNVTNGANIILAPQAKLTFEGAVTMTIYQGSFDGESTYTFDETTKVQVLGVADTDTVIQSNSTTDVVTKTYTYTAAAGGKITNGIEYKSGATVTVIPLSEAEDTYDIATDGDYVKIGIPAGTDSIELDVDVTRGTTDTVDLDLVQGATTYITITNATNVTTVNGDHWEGGLTIEKGSATFTGYTAAYTKGPINGYSLTGAETVMLPVGESITAATGVVIPAGMELSKAMKITEDGTDAKLIATLGAGFKANAAITMTAATTSVTTFASNGGATATKAAWDGKITFGSYITVITLGAISMGDAYFAASPTTPAAATTVKVYGALTFASTKALTTGGTNADTIILGNGASVPAITAAMADVIQVEANAAGVNAQVTRTNAVTLSNVTAGTTALSITMTGETQTTIAGTSIAGKITHAAAFTAITLSSGASVYGLNASAAVLTCDADAGTTIAGDTVLKGINNTGDSTLEITGSKLTLGVTGLVQSAGTGSIVVSGATIATPDDGCPVTATTGTIELSGILNGIINTTTSNIHFKDFTINSGALVKIDNGTTINVTGTTYLYGGMKVNDDDATHAATVTVAAEKKFMAFAGAQIDGRITIGGTGTIDVSNAIFDQKVSENIAMSKTYGQLENVIITETLEVRNYAVVTILGGFQVDEGKTLTINSGSTVEINSKVASVNIKGKVVVQEGAVFKVTDAKGVNISGAVISDGKIDFGPKTEVLAGGYILSDVGENGSSKFKSSADLIIDKDATLTLRGTLEADATVTNKGTVSVDGLSIGYNLTINMAADGAVANVKSVSATGSKAVTITDLGLEFPTGATPAEVADGKQNTVAITLTADKTVRGLTVIESTKVSKEVYYTSMDLSGNVTGVVTSTGADFGADQEIDVVINSAATVKDELNLGKKIKLNVDTATNKSLNVTGKITSIEAIDNAGGVIDVSGLIKVPLAIGINTEAKVNGVKFLTTEGTTTYSNYTSLEKAIDAEATEITVLGEITVSKNLTVPAGITVKNGTITVSKDAKLTIGDGATMRGNAMKVNGTLYFEDKADNRTASIVSDVSVIGDVDALYTNIYAALAAADAGDVVTVTKNMDPVKLDADLTIKAGVMLDVPVSRSLEVTKPITVAVYGVLKSASAIGIAEGLTFGEKITDTTAVITIGKTGTIMTGAAIPGYDTYKVSGAYFSLANSVGNYNYITTLSNASVYDSDLSTITVYGTVVETEAILLEGATTGLTLTVAGSLEANLTIDRVTVVMTGADGYTGTITDDAGAIKLSDVKGLTVTSSVVKGEDVLTVTGTAARATDLASTTAAKIEFSAGGVNAGTSDAAFTVNNTDTKKMSVKVAGDAEMESVKATVTNITVDGTLSVANGGSFIGTNTVIMGVLIIEDKETTSSSFGTFTAGKLFVGVASSVFKATSDAAVVSGNPDSFTLDYMIVLAGSSFPEEIVEDAKKTVYTVDGKEYLTVYAINGNAMLIKEIVVPSKDNTVINGWYYMSSGKEVKISDTALIGSQSSVFAKYTEDIYTVRIVTDAGIKSVAIDGIEMISVGNNIFTQLNLLKAGTHTVSYTLKNGYEGTAQLYTADNTILKDLKFTASGNPETGADTVDLTFQLYGTEQIIAPEPSPVEQNEWTITTILLVILVILIAIMAVIVAIRLNRS